MFWEDENNIFSSYDSVDKLYEYAEDVICILFQKPKSDTNNFEIKIAIDYVYAVLVMLCFKTDVGNASTLLVSIWDLDYYLNEFEETKEEYLYLREYGTEKILIDKNCEKGLFDIIDDGYDYRSLCREIGFRFNAWINGETDLTDFSYVVRT